MEPFARRTVTVRHLGSMEFVADIQKSVNIWTILNIENWPEGLFELKSPMFEDSASNEWCMGISRRGAVLFVRLHLLSSIRDKSLKIKVRVLLISRNETIWESPEKNYNLKGLEKTISWGIYDDLKWNRLFDSELKLQGEVRLRKVLIKHKRSNRVHQMAQCLANLRHQERTKSVETVATDVVECISPSLSLPVARDTVHDLESVAFVANMQKTVCTWTITNLKNWPEGVKEVVSPTFRDSASNKWYMTLSRSAAVLFTHLHLVASQQELSMKAKVRALLMHKDEAIWACREKTVNLNGPEKTFLCGSYDYFQLIRFFDIELTLQGEVHLFNVQIERRRR